MMLIMVSGGADSATLLWQFKDAHKCRAVCFDYGQKHKREIDSARQLCELAKVKLDVVRVGDFMASAFSDNVFPGRNLVFLSVATSLALQHGLISVGFAATRDDWQMFPDCRRTFVDAARRAMELTATSPVSLVAPYLELTRKQVVEIGRTCSTPYELTWSCYEGQDIPCGQCIPCVSRKEVGI